MVQIAIAIGVILSIIGIGIWVLFWPSEMVFPKSFTEVAESEEFRSYLSDELGNAGFIWGRRDDGRYYLVLGGFINRFALRQRWPKSRG